MYNNSQEPNSNKAGTIEVFENESNYLVRIHPKNKERAKKIDERYWDGSFWSYPKNIKIYNALYDEFKNDADRFDIKKPKNLDNSNLKKLECDSENFDSKVAVNDDDYNDNKKSILVELNKIHELLKYYYDVSINQNRALKEVNEKNERSNNILSKIHEISLDSNKNEPEEAVPISLDIDKTDDLLIFEKTLVELAINISNKNLNFINLLKKYSPIVYPGDFVGATHEFIKTHLSTLLEDENNNFSFHEVISKLNEEKIFNENNTSNNFKKEKTPDVIILLRTINFLRNKISHPGDFNQYERLNLSILYLMNVSRLWNKIIPNIEPEQ